MKTKQQMRLEIKEISAEGYFEGLLSPYGNVDGGGDVVEPGAYTKTLQERGNKIPMLWQHKTDVPIGELTLDDRADGLYCKGQLLMALPEAQKAYLLVKAGIVKGLSIGFETVKDAIEKGVRRLKEIKLYEGSVVTFPMNEMALISGIKGAADESLATALAAICESSLTAEEKCSAVELMLAEAKASVDTAADKSIVAEAYSRAKSITDILAPLVDEAGKTTSQPQAVTEQKTEPVLDHSAISSLLTQAKETYKWNYSNN